MNNNKNKNNNKEVKQTYMKNPTETLYGKILIWVLIALMVVVPIASVIFAIFS